ncbi:unnamed protein product [Clonostachys rhizophaga]|uniref:Amine oxidase domain-containing protein n=1 Tax=Clonostachys rhizophaga TaxID=160324 RepID=A0A9N9YCL8_9HYPO|nr:unnamed protein product [Clonostachys rhizophaga]
MDAYSICCTNSAGRSTSKIYQDLKAIRNHSLPEFDPGYMLKKISRMEASKQRETHGIDTRPHVAIVGAGLAGLRCADVLTSYGLKVTVLEARDRIGGRVHQETLANGRLVDMGPNWIHGTSNNPIIGLAQETSTSVGSWDTETYIFNESGILFPRKEGQEYADMMWDIIQDAFKYSNKYSSFINDKESLLDFFEEKVVEKIPSTLENYEQRRRIVLQLSQSWGNFIGSAVGRQSLKFFWLEECLEGENLFCAGTYQKILELVGQPVLTGAAGLKLRTKVEKIFSRTQPTDMVKLQVNGGQILEFDEVVVTCPLGWLKQNLEAFEPCLPQRITSAIGSISYGCLEKVYISFQEAFWLSNDEEEGRHVQGFVQWMTPNYATETNPNKWNQEVVELANLNPKFAHPTLLFYIYGDQSDYITSNLVKLTNQVEKNTFLINHFRPYFSRLPHFSDQSPACKVIGCRATEWRQDELAGHGSYANFQVGLQDGDGDIRAMRQGVPEQGLWLAGEHTAPFVALGTATGAYWSGESVGRRIAEAYGVAKESVPNGSH